MRKLISIQVFRGSSVTLYEGTTTKSRGLYYVRDDWKCTQHDTLENAVFDFCIRLDDGMSETGRNDVFLRLARQALGLDK